MDQRLKKSTLSMGQNEELTLPDHGVNELMGT
jgi:hypothetical protein